MGNLNCVIDEQIVMPTTYEEYKVVSRKFDEMGVSPHILIHSPYKKFKVKLFKRVVEEGEDTKSVFAEIIKAVNESDYQYAAAYSNLAFELMPLVEGDFNKIVEPGYYSLIGTEEGVNIDEKLSQLTNESEVGIHTRLSRIYSKFHDGRIHMMVKSGFIHDVLMQQANDTKNDSLKKAMNETDRVVLGVVNMDAGHTFKDYDIPNAVVFTNGCMNLMSNMQNKNLESFIVFICFEGVVNEDIKNKLNIANEQILKFMEQQQKDEALMFQSPEQSCIIDPRTGEPVGSPYPGMEW